MARTGDLSGLRLNLATLVGEDNTFEGFLPPESLTGLQGLVRLAQPVAVVFTMGWKRRRMHVQGRFQGSMVRLCDRCLKEFEVAFAEEIDRFFRIGEDPSVRELESHMEEDDVYLPDGVFSPRRMVEEDLILSLDMTALCSRQCRGLCPSCGKDLNVEDCQCPQEEPDNPFAVLKALKKQ